MTEIAIIGAGASGMAAAISAAEDSENHVCLFERQSRVGRKLLSTGNGRCNLTNISGLSGRYHGENPDFANAAFERFDVKSNLEFFKSLGLNTVTQEDGRVYPLSDHAGSVLDVLRFALDRPNIELRLGETVTYLEKQGERFVVGTDSGISRFDKVIVACGGAAGSKHGGVMDGYAILKSLGHRRTGLYPSLTMLKTPPEFPRSLKGVKADAGVRVFAGRHCLAESAGEVLFTDTGVSGPAIFDVSRAASTGGAGLTISLDFLREHTPEQTMEELRTRQEIFADRSAQEILTGSVHNRLGKMLCKYSEIPAGATAGDLQERDLERLCKALKDFRLDILGAAGFEFAQVTAGGISTSDFESETLESRLVPGLFVCGELLDIDGDCGGFNLQWAWSSGRLAGRLGKC